MQKAYIIIAHKNPEQLYRLISRLNDGKSDFFVHIDKKAEFTQFEVLKDFGSKLNFLSRFDSKWGSLGTIEPFINGLQAILNRPEAVDRIMLLSGQDYPIKSNRQIDEFFENSPFSVFIDHFPIPNNEKWPGSDRGGLYRVDKYYFGAQWYELFCSRSLNLISRFLPFLKRKIPGALHPYTGQTWWNLDNRAAHYILDYHTEHPEYIDFHKNTFVADELFVQMIIANATDQQLLASIANKELRFTIWKDVTDAHPKILTLSDFEAIRASGDLFARKFDTLVDSAILDRIDQEILTDHRAQ